MKKPIRLLGIAVAIAAFAYFVVYAHRSLAGQDLSQFLRPDVLLAGALLTALYATLVPITAIAWSWLLKGLGQPVAFAITGPVLAITQMGKYLPGNVAQHFGRVLMARSFGLRTAPLILSMSYETVLLVAACAHASALSLLWVPPPGMEDWVVFRHQVPAIALITLGALVALVLLPAAARWLSLRRSPGALPLDTRPRWTTSAACYAGYLMNFAVIGAGLWVAAGTLVPAGTPVPALPFFIGAFAASWILGFLAPGAPAGLGVREAALALWFEPAMGAAAGILLILLLRVATTLGDLGNFVWGSTRLARLRART